MFTKNKILIMALPGLATPKSENDAGSPDVLKEIWKLLDKAG
ncbi:hypothetical protein [Methylocystis sp.]